jgi:hypothetical protein
MIETIDATVCTRCSNQTLENPSGRKIAGLITCYFCGEKVTTGNMESYDVVMFDNDDDPTILVVTKIKDGLVFHSLNDGEISGTYKMHKDDISEMLINRGNLYLHLVDYGFIE